MNKQQTQNRRWKVFNRGSLRLCGGFDTLKIDKNSTDLKCFMFQFGGLGALFGELSPQKPLPGDGTEQTVDKS